MKEIIRIGEAGIPELADGFDPSLETMTDGMEVRGFYAEAEGAGIYRVSWKLQALRDVKSLYLFVGRKNLCFLGSLKAGETAEGMCCTHICQIIPRYHEEIMEIGRVCFTMACEDTEAVAFTVLEAEKLPEDTEIPVIYLAGDSTVTDQSSEIPYHPGGCYASWGQALAYYTGSCGAVDNQAHCGLTTETFRQEGHYSVIEKNLRPGDYCLFQFGHNDQKLSHLQAHTGYRDRILCYIREIRSKGGIPILVTPLGRNIWNMDGTYNDLLKEYADTVKAIGRETQTPVIDLHGYSTAFYREHGEKESRNYFHPYDATHTNEYGAYLFAGVIAEGLENIGSGRFAGVRKAAECASFVPEGDIWDCVNRGRDGRNKTGEQKEQFDAVEKSVAALIAVVEQAGKDAD